MIGAEALTAPDGVLALGDLVVSSQAPEALGEIWHDNHVRSRLDLKAGTAFTEG